MANRVSESIILALSKNKLCGVHSRREYAKLEDWWPKNVTCAEEREWNNEEIQHLFFRKRSRSRWECDQRSTCWRARQTDRHRVIWRQRKHLRHFASHIEIRSGLSYRTRRWCARRERQWITQPARQNEKIWRHPVCVPVSQSQFKRRFYHSRN